MVHDKQNMGEFGQTTHSSSQGSQVNLLEAYDDSFIQTYSYVYAYFHMCLFL